MKKTKDNRRKTSRNTWIRSGLIHEKFGIKIPNSVKEALLLDKIKGDTK